MNARDLFSAGTVRMCMLPASGLVKLSEFHDPMKDRKRVFFELLGPRNRPLTRSRVLETFEEGIQLTEDKVSSSHLRVVPGDPAEVELKKWQGCLHGPGACFVFPILLNRQLIIQPMSDPSRYPDDEFNAVVFEARPGIADRFWQWRDAVLEVVNDYDTRC